MTNGLTPSTARRVTRSSTVRNDSLDEHGGAKTISPAKRSRAVKSVVKTVPRRTRPPGYMKTISKQRTPPLHASRFRLIQEQVAHNLYQLLVAATLWNRTKGVHAKPVFLAVLRQYPSPEHLAKAVESDLAALLYPVGLYNTRAKRLISFAQAWLQSPPTKSRRYRSLRYPSVESGRNVKPNEVLDEGDPREGWEISHLPGVGPYALDSFRIFHRDVLRGLATDWEGTGAPLGFEPEWKRVVPLDKELKAYIRWKWLKEGWAWDPSSGHKVAVSAKRMKVELARKTSLSPEWI